MIVDEEGVWGYPWIRSCAIYAAGKLGLSQTAEGIEAALSADEPAIRETAAWALSNLAPHRFQAHLAALLTDQDPRVAHLAAEMAAIEH
jgi:HEAT repeat protein